MIEAGTSARRARSWRSRPATREAPLDGRRSFVYDTAGRLSILRNAKSDGSPLSYFEYGRLAGGNVSRIKREDGGAVYYTYDYADRLVIENWRDSGHALTRYFSYSYDDAGNRTQEDKNGQPVYYYYDEANQLTHRNAPTGGSDAWTYFAYDENGSMLREYNQALGTCTYYAYAGNGLASRVAPPGSATYFHYDARQQRFAIEFGAGGWGEAPWGTSPYGGSGGGTAGLAYFGWDGMNQLVEKDDTLATVAEHTHGDFGGHNTQLQEGIEIDWSG